MPISTISTIYLTVDGDVNPSKQSPGENETNKSKWYYSDMFLALLLFPSILVLAILIDSFFQAGWNEKFAINYCIVGLTIIFFGGIIATMCYYAIGLRSRFSRESFSATINSSPVDNVPNEFESNALPPNYNKIYPIEEILPPSYESVVTNDKNATAQRDFTAIAVYI